MLKCFLIVCLLLVSSLGAAYYCPPMSKNPNCFVENIFNTVRPRPCMGSKLFCVKIESVHLVGNNQYKCKSSALHEFSCTKLVHKRGPYITGLNVNVLVPYVDTCHVLGGCGGRACLLSYGTATLDVHCRN